MDCVPEDEPAACPDGGLRDLFLRGRFGEGLFLFDGDIAKLCGIKDFSATLAFNKLCVFLAGDDLDDWMFALGGHGEEIANALDFARLWAPCQLRFHLVSGCEFAVNSWWNAGGSVVAMYMNVDVHSCRTEIVLFWAIFG